MRVLFVCHGNICRSPLAEGIFRRQALERGLNLEIDSAGTSNYHEGELPDPRAQQVGQARGCVMSMRSRPICSADFQNFDLIVVMDRENLANVLRMPGARASRVRMATSFSNSGYEVVPDPYYGGTKGFEEVADLLESVCTGLLDDLVSGSLNLRPLT